MFPDGDGRPRPGQACHTPTSKLLERLESHRECPHLGGLFHLVFLWFPPLFRLPGTCSPFFSLFLTRPPRSGPCPPGRPGPVSITVPLPSAHRLKSAVRTCRSEDTHRGPGRFAARGVAPPGRAEAEPTQRQAALEAELTEFAPGVTGRGFSGQGAHGGGSGGQGARVTRAAARP